MTNDESQIQAVRTGDKGDMSLRLHDGQVIPLSEVDIKLLQLCFHTHCPDCVDHP